MFFCKEKLLERLGGNEELMDEILQTFVNDIPKQIEMIITAIEEENYDGIKRYAHSIKGAAGNINAMGITNAADCLEKINNNSEKKILYDKLDDLKNEFVKFNNELNLVS